jgi:ABC-type branched-subunit amino acid transport system substrate-binding protein
LEVKQETQADPVFRGLRALLDSIRELICRPHWLPKTNEIRGDRTLPILCLIGEASLNKAFLTSLWRRLRAAKNDRVPHVYVDAAVAHEKSMKRPGDKGKPPLLPILDELHREFSADRFGGDGIGRFQHYELANSLTGDDGVAAGGHTARSEVLKLLRDWYCQNRANERRSMVMTVLAAAFASWHRRARARLWSRGLPLLGREPHWFMTQPFMVPQHSLTFPGFAERLTVARRGEEEPDQIKKLLVHAFLQDLRVAYAPRRLRLRRWRRTAYPLAVIDDVTEENGGWELLRLINDVRNERGDLDPLLVIAGTGQFENQPRETTTRAVLPVHKIKTALLHWQNELPTQRQKMTDDARFVSVFLSDADPSNDDEGAWPDTPAIHARKPPWPARRWSLLAIIVAVLIGPAYLLGTWTATRISHDCLPDPSAGVAALWDDGLVQCLGYSDDQDLIFGTDIRLQQVESAIFEQNEIAEDLHANDPHRLVASVVYFAGISHTVSAPGTDQSIAEELEGLLLKQHEQNHARRTDPALRVIIANGGTEMKGAYRVVQDLLTPLFREDPTIVGVIGMDRTVPETEQAIAALGDLGVPVVATTLTGEGLPARSPLYFQLVPGNRVQAELIAGYARTTRRKVTIYHPRLTDGYLRTLVGATQAALGNHARPSRAWSDRADNVPVRCGSAEIAFYAGRESQFGDFVRNVVDTCDRNELPQIIGDDTIIRFIAQVGDRERPELNQLPVYWVDMGSLVALAGDSCRTEGNPDTSKAWSPMLAFCDGYQWLHQISEDKPKAANDYATTLRGTGRIPWAGQGVGLAYDAAGLYVHAVLANLKRPRGTADVGLSQRGAIAQELREGPDFPGATGVISFHDSRDGSRRNLAILEIENARDISAVPRCESIVGDIYDSSTTGRCPS